MIVEIMKHWEDSCLYDDYFKIDKTTIFYSYFQLKSLLSIYKNTTVANEAYPPDTSFLKKFKGDFSIYPFPKHTLFS
jgi:hypothetical protein